MAVIHHTTIKPTKLELLTSWLPTRSWYSGGDGPELVKSGGFRLDDPEGEVGIEFMAVTDVSGTDSVAYLVPMTYRGAPLDGAEDALIGTMEHGVLGRRWVYDACHDPVAVAQLLALIEGKVQAQAQSTSDTEDRDVARSYDGAELDPEGLRVSRVLQPDTEPDSGATGHVVSWWQTPDGDRVRGVFAAVYPGSTTR